MYDHYRFRFQAQKKGDSVYDGLSTTDEWQAKYFDATNAASPDSAWWR